MPKFEVVEVCQEIYTAHVEAESAEFLHQWYEDRGMSGLNPDHDEGDCTFTVTQIDE